MSYQNDPWSNPYGQPGAAGQGQYGPAAPGHSEYGTTPIPGQYRSPYAGGPMPGQFGPPGAPVRTSSTNLVIAGVLQIVQSVPFLIAGIFAMLAGNSAGSLIRDAGIGSDVQHDVRATLIVAGAILAILAITMIVLAAITLRRSDGCRIASAVLQIIFGALWLLATVGAVAGSSNPALSLILLISCVVVTVLLLSGSASRATKQSYSGFNSY